MRCYCFVFLTLCFLILELVARQLKDGFFKKGDSREMSSRVWVKLAVRPLWHLLKDNIIFQSEIKEHCIVPLINKTNYSESLVLGTVKNDKWSKI